jgi:hypothetical protein
MKNGVKKKKSNSFNSFKVISVGLYSFKIQIQKNYSIQRFFYEFESQLFTKQLIIKSNVNKCLN